MQEDSRYREQMYSIVEDWQRSGQNRQAYCRSHAIGYHRFLYWHRKYKAAHEATPKDPSSFISLMLPANQVAPTELIYPDGRRLLFPQGVEAAYLKILLG
jgi:hypothetical protein